MDIAYIFCTHAHNVLETGTTKNAKDLLDACYSLGGELAQRRVTYVLLRGAVEHRRDVIVEYIFSINILDGDTDYDFCENICELAHRLEYMLPIRYMLRCGLHPLSEYLFLHAFRHGHVEAMEAYLEAGVYMNPRRAMQHIDMGGAGKHLSEEEIQWRLSWLADNTLRIQEYAVSCE